MFILIWTTLFFSVRSRYAATAASNWRGPNCQKGSCVTLSQEEITAEAGLSVVIPCSFSNVLGFTPQNIIWYKCEPTKQTCDDSDLIFHNKYNRKVKSGYDGRVSLVVPDLRHGNCSIIIDDLTESDSGSYQVRFNDFLHRSARVTVSIKGHGQHCESCSDALPWAVAGVSLSVNVFYTIFVIFLWKARKKKEADRIYMSLQKTDRSPEYDVINRPPD